MAYAPVEVLVLTTFSPIVIVQVMSPPPPFCVVGPPRQVAGGPRFTPGPVMWISSNNAAPADLRGCGCGLRAVPRGYPDAIVDVVVDYAAWPVWSALEYWIPAAELDDFNANIVGQIPGSRPLPICSVRQIICVRRSHPRLQHSAGILVSNS